MKGGIRTIFITDGVESGASREGGRRLLLLVQGEVFEQALSGGFHQARGPDDGGRVA
jgi:hypothetical protein